jgi:hypothetical protein
MPEVTKEEVIAEIKSLTERLELLYRHLSAIYVAEERARNVDSGTEKIQIK